MNTALNNKKVLVTRERSQALSFSNLLTPCGATPIEVPLLAISCLNIKKELSRLTEGTIEWIFFTSVHGIHCFVNQLEDVSVLKRCKIATVGHKTELALKKYNLKADFIPTTYNAEVMSKEFLELYPHANNLLLVRGSISRKELIEAFTKHDILFDTLTVYETNFNKKMQQELIEILNEHQFDFLTFTSPSTVQAFELFVEGDARVNDFLNIPAVCIGTTTEKSAIKAGFKYTFIPKSFTIESMVEKMEEIVQMEG